MQAYFNPTRRNMNQKSVKMQAYFNPTRRNMKVKIGLIIKLATLRFLGWRAILNSLSIQRNFSNCPMNDIFSGCNRMRTMEDLELHFGVEALRVFRFSLEQIDELMTVLQVVYMLNFLMCIYKKLLRFQRLSSFVVIIVLVLRL